jgi:hypothetical protein
MSQVLLIYASGDMTLISAEEYGYRFDLSDCDALDGVVQALATDIWLKLVPVTVGESTKVESDEECPLVYATAPIMAGIRRIGTVQLTDH